MVGIIVNKPTKIIRGLRESNGIKTIGPTW